MIQTNYLKSHLRIFVSERRFLILLHVIVLRETEKHNYIRCEMTRTSQQECWGILEYFEEPDDTYHIFRFSIFRLQVRLQLKYNYFSPNRTKIDFIPFSHCHTTTSCFRYLILQSFFILFRKKSMNNNLVCILCILRKHFILRQQIL